MRLQMMMICDKIKEVLDLHPLLIFGMVPNHGNTFVGRHFMCRRNPARVEEPPYEKSVTR